MTLTPDLTPHRSPDHSPGRSPDPAFSLADRYTAEHGEVLLTGIHALVRGPLDQLRADRRAGRRTTAFISGYQGSPLGGYDREVQANRELLDELGVVHRPALNEELGATSVMGSQLVSTIDARRYDGVVGVWYGKSPGVDRAGDAIRHAQFAGTAPLGGVLALVGDDPACKSSTLPSRSDATLAALGMPVLYPGTMQDVVDLCRHGVELSRASGLWSAIKVVTAIADGSGLAVVDPDRIRPEVPVLERDGRVWSPALTGHIGPTNAILMEAEVLGTRMEMVQAYLSANGLNRIVVDPPDAWLGIVAAGHVAEQVLDTLGVLGVDRARAADLGIRLLKLDAVHPVDGDAVRRLARGVRTVLVVEDKQPILEVLVRDALYGVTDRPIVIGKHDANGAPLVPLAGALTAASLSEPLRRVVEMVVAPDRLRPPRRDDGLRITIAPEAMRTPFFCSGCPHNTSTKVPEGALVGAGIGCHGMIVLMDGPSRGEVLGITQMGGEGAQWIGMAPFVETPHLFQNLGDGTFCHSGQLAVQAAIAAGVTMTFKLLYNAAVAMTGGQDATGLLPVPQVATKLIADGVREIIITTDDPAKYRRVGLPARTRVWHRDRIIEAQEHLRQVEGVTVLVHDQQCAAEKRRDRKRGLLPTPATKVVIDHRVCEGCGDCGVQSNCLSLQPLDTEFGRKTVVDQASCNLDTSCLKGDCPAFLTVTPADRATRPAAAAPDQVPDPDLVVPAEGVTIRMPGVGGTGVVTISQLLGAAAKIDGRDAHAVDQTGLSQKAGPVVSTTSIGSARPGVVDVLVGFDLLVAVTPANLTGLDPASSIVIASTSLTPTGRMVGRPDSAAVEVLAYLGELDRRSRAPLNRYVDASGLTIGLLGSALTANTFLLGVAYQAGAIPLTATAIERAIELNGAAMDANLAAFRWGRAWVVDPAQVDAAAGREVAVEVDRAGLDDLADDAELQRMVAVRRAELVEYQGRALADRYLATVRRVRAAEQAAGGDGTFTRTVSHHLHRLMAYKDEYEVARLLLTSRDRAEQAVGPVRRVTWNLHPPVLRGLGMQRKLRLGEWSRPALVALRSMKHLRGTRLDPFGRSEVRRTERQLVREYEQLVDRLLSGLRDDPARCAHMAALVDVVRGYEAVKLRNVASYRAALAEAGY
jgi:indolepyruvate ferredoxin oxidoreductase